MTTYALLILLNNLKNPAWAEVGRYQTQAACEAAGRSRRSYDNGPAAWRCVERDPPPVLEEVQP